MARSEAGICTPAQPASSAAAAMRGAQLRADDTNISAEFAVLGWLHVVVDRQARRLAMDEVRLGERGRDRLELDGRLRVIEAVDDAVRILVAPAQRPEIPVVL